MYSHTLQEFFLKQKGAQEVREHQWQHTRALAFAISKPHLKNKKLTIEKFWPLPSDQVSGIAALKSKEERYKAYLKERKWYEDQGLVRVMKPKTEVNAG